MASSKPLFLEQRGRKRQGRQVIAHDLFATVVKHKSEQKPYGTLPWMLPNFRPITVGNCDISRPLGSLSYLVYMQRSVKTPSADLPFDILYSV